jgi:hypothetical protein
MISEADWITLVSFVSGGDRIEVKVALHQIGCCGVDIICYKLLDVFNLLEVSDTAQASGCQGFKD